MPDNGSGRKAGHLRVEDVPWEEIRALVWEQRRCRALCFEPYSAVAVRVVDGERLTTGYSEGKLMVAIDLARMLERLGREIGHHRRRRFEEWLDGQPVARFGQIEQVQLADDVRRVEEMVNAGGYRFMLVHYHASGSR